ncbi:IS3 family transposase [Thiomicrorhabdus arctica]|uniref:IS3 family transposase n=1 Tax=Thiomicrorhabdus arctica TaxID=131540 RepID=UPI001FE22066|nr:IS3 family transposase [Thiomicrorhabdus arctica]
MEAQQMNYPVALLCKCLDVSKSGFYHWKTAPVSQRSKHDNYLLLKIIEAYKAGRKNYGSPRVYNELKAKSISISLNKVARMMKKHGIHAVTSIKHKKAKIARNTRGFSDNVLDREFTAIKPGKKWVSDTTFVYTRQGWLYLAVIIDLYSRKVIGWSMSQYNDTKLVSRALEMAVKVKPIKEQVLLHSDQGSTYRADAYLALFKNNKIMQSMSRKGECHDNAVAESFFSTLKSELVYQTTYQTREEAKSSIFEYIEVFYNKVRRHSYLNYESPKNYEMAFYNRV